MKIHTPSPFLVAIQGMCHSQMEDLIISDDPPMIMGNWITMMGLLTILLLSGWAFDHGDFDLWAFVRPGF